MSITGNVVFSPAVTKHDKTEMQMFESTSRMRENTEIQMGATKELRTKHTDNVFLSSAQ